MRLGRIIIGVMSFLAGMSFMAEGSDRPIVAVFNIEAKGVNLSSDVIDRLNDYFGSLVSERGYQIVPRSELKKRLFDQKNESQKMCYDTSCQIELGKELAAQKSIAAQLIKLGKKCKVALALYDLKKAASESGTTESGGCEEEDIVLSLEGAVDKMMGKAWSATTNKNVAQTLAADQLSDVLKLAWRASLPASVEFTSTEVTVSQYTACIRAGNCTEPKSKSENKFCNYGYADRDIHPINCVDWNQAEVYCRWVGGRLPTENEWQLEASNKGTREFAWGNEPATCENAIWSQGGASGCGKDSTWPVCSRPKGKSISGLCDMTGNVLEWTSSARDSARVLRGGSWLSSNPVGLRSMLRTQNDPITKRDDIGFRCARVPQ